MEEPDWETWVRKEWLIVVWNYIIENKLDNIVSVINQDRISSTRVWLVVFDFVSKTGMI